MNRTYLKLGKQKTKWIQNPQDSMLIYKHQEKIEKIQEKHFWSLTWLKGKCNDLLKMKLATRIWRSY